MSKPQVAGTTPLPVDVEAGKTYFWCRCGQSQRQPFCDGSHKDTGLEPMAYKAEKTGTVFFCNCKHTRREPLCDGSHSTL